MSRLPILGGSYLARSVIANAQRCVNYYPEHNPKDAGAEMTLYQRPGLRPLATPAAAQAGRGLYKASNGNGYAVIGQGVYSISLQWVLTQIGQLANYATTPVYMIDNGVTVVLADGSSSGYQWTLATNGNFTPIADPTGTFTGATKFDYLDTFLLWNVLNAQAQATNAFGTMLSNEIAFDPLYVAGKTSYPDPIVNIAVCKRELVLVGSLKSEIWYDAGNTGYPFAELPGSSIEHGTCAPYSVCQQDVSVYMLSQELQGQGIVLRIRGYMCERISNHAVEYALRQIVANGGTLSDCVAYTYQTDGHVFVVFNFTSGDQTWVFDEASQQWHQRAWTDANGVLHRERVQVVASLNETIVGLDWQNGTLYALDPNVYTDTVSLVQGPISFIRGFPHILYSVAENGQPVPTDGRRVQVSAFVLDMDCGDAPGPGPGPDGDSPNIIGLRWSTNRGHTFGNTVLQSAGKPGEYLTYPQWLQEGIARDFVFEISHSINGPAAIQGAWINSKVLAS